MSGPVLIRIGVKASAPWIGPLYSFLNEIRPGSSGYERILRRVMIYGLLAPIRKNFISRLSQALVLHIDNRPKTKAIAEYMEGSARVKMIKEAYDAMDEAYSDATSGFGSNYEAVQKANERLRRAMNMQEAANEKTNEQQDSKKRMMTLSAVTSGLMRNNALLVLDALTSPANIQVASTGIQGNGIGTYVTAGSAHRLDQIQTPSATALLMRSQTSSDKKALWKHLEFGTGALRSKKKVQGLDMNVGKSKHGNSDGTWWYGQSYEMPGAGIKVRGSQPMDVLWGSDGKPLPEYQITAQQALDAAIEAIKPRL